MEYLIRKANGTTVRVSRDEYERILSRVAEGERADKLVEKCQCGDRRASQCPEPWEPGCDLGNNEAHVQVSTRESRPLAYMYHDARTASDANPLMHSMMLVHAADRRPGMRGETPLYPPSQRRLELIGFMSPKHVPMISDREDECGFPVVMRKTQAGLFTLALYAERVESLSEERRWGAQ